MKALITLILTSLVSTAALATTDAQTTVFLVTQDHNTMTYDVVGYQFSGCYGIEFGPQTAVFTEPFLIQAPRGCGGTNDWQEDVNALSCASSDWKWDEGHTFVRGVTIDLSKCEAFDLNELKFATKLAVRKNFGAFVDVNFK